MPRKVLWKSLVHYVVSYVFFPAISDIECYILWVMSQIGQASEKGQPPYKRQNARSQLVRYSEVLLYTYDITVDSGLWIWSKAIPVHQTPADFYSMTKYTTLVGGPMECTKLLDIASYDITVALSTMMSYACVHSINCATYKCCVVGHAGPATSDCAVTGRRSS